MPGMKALPLPEVLQLLDKLPLKYQALCAIGVTTGSRITEILKLRRFDLLTRDGVLKDQISFIKLKTKSAKVIHRKIGLPAKYHKYVLDHLRAEELRGYDRPDDLVFRGQKNRPLSRITVYHIFRDKLGEGYGTHWMRKTFAQELFHYFLQQNSRDPMRALELTRNALDHARLDTTVRYLGITEESIENAQNAIFNQTEAKKPQMEAKELWKFTNREAIKIDDRTLFERITASPEVLAEKLVEDTMDGTMFYSILTREDYCTKEIAIAATVAKLKAVCK